MSFPCLIGTGIFLVGSLKKIIGSNDNDTKSKAAIRTEMTQENLQRFYVKGKMRIFLVKINKKKTKKYCKK